MEAHAELIARARLICGTEHVLTNPRVLSTYRSDGIRRDGALPLAAILPSSTSEVSGVVAACRETGVRLRVRGAGTSRAGFALPMADEVLVVLTRMRAILSDSGDELTVQSGVPVAALPRDRRWLRAVEPVMPVAERQAAPTLNRALTAAAGTVGGHIAEHGASADIAAMDLVRPNGEIVRIDRRHPGYDFTGAFPGSRGAAGIAATITLRSMCW